MKVLYTAEEKGIQEKQFIQVPFDIEELKAEGEDDSSIVSFTGYASTFGNKDLGRDVVVTGAFKDTIKKDGVAWPILHMHNPYEQMGWNAEAEEDRRGLKVRGELNLAVQRAKEQYELARHCKERGGKMGLSIGYRPEVWEIDQDKRVRYLKSVKMYEYSFVVWPMNPKARIAQIKSLLDESGFLHEAEDGITDLKEICGSARMMEKLLCEVGHSNSVAKALAAASVRMKNGESLREVGLASDPQLKKACETMQSLIRSLGA